MEFLGDLYEGESTGMMGMKNLARHSSESRWSLSGDSEYRVLYWKEQWTSFLLLLQPLLNLSVWTSHLISVIPQLLYE